MSQLTAEAVQEQVERILASPGFVKADRLRRFLRFTVEASLRGEQDSIKEFLIGREVFDRDGSYDPRLDPIVRVEARRLRARLEDYYGGAGGGDPIRIEFPRGGYAPSIRLAGDPAARKTSRRRWLLIGVLAAVVASAAGIGVYRALTPAAPAVVVIPARWVFSDTAKLDPADEPLAEQITAAIANRGETPVVGWPTLAARRSRESDPSKLAAALGADRQLVVAARPAGSGLRVTVFMTSVGSGRKLWVEEYMRTGLESLEVQRQLATQVAERVGRTSQNP